MLKMLRDAFRRYGSGADGIQVRNLTVPALWPRSLYQEAVRLARNRVNRIAGTTTQTKADPHTQSS